MEVAFQPDIDQERGVKLEQLKSKLEKIIGIEKHAGKVRKDRK